MKRFAAVDLGASSGRVILGSVSPDAVSLREVHRFPNRPVRVGETLHWDVLELWRGILDGLQGCGDLDGIAVDSWAVDYALLDRDGALLGNPVHYRDTRTDGVTEMVDAAIPAESLYAVTGVQRLPFNTLYQLVAARQSAAMAAAAALLMIPDLFAYWLTGERVGEVTNASTTGLFDVHSRTWSTELADRLELRSDLFPPVVEPGSRIGDLRGSVARECGIDAVPVWAAATHDTASAVLGAPARGKRFAYISCGTWSLVGVELSAPITTEAALAANFTNELGVDGTVRFLRNVMGLWLLQESIRTWEHAGKPIDLPALLAEAAHLPARRSIVDPDRPEFLPPGNMPARLQAECRRTGQPVPGTPPELTRCILDSLAAAYHRAVTRAVELTSTPVEVIHLVGGGAQNTLLCQLTADACELPVIAGPVEAAAYGNVLVQARAAGEITGDIADLRARIPTDSWAIYTPH